jgi:hypothetical protein
MKKFYLLLAIAVFCFIEAKAGDTARFTTEVHISTATIVFTNTSTLDGSFDRKAWWSFGDGTSLQTSPLSGAEHHYARPGTYHVCLRLYSYTSATDSVLRSESCKDVTIESVCTAKYEYHDSISYSPFSHNLTFSAIPYNNGNNAVTKVCWDFGDGTTQCVQASVGSSTSSLLTIKHTYPPTINTLSTYNACVTITYDGGCEAKDCHIIYLQNPGVTNCQTGFTTGLLSSNALGRTFSVTTSPVANPKPLKVCWNFADGSDIQCFTYAGTYTGTYSTYHIFPHTGQYQVCVVVNYDGGCEAKECEVVTVSAGDATCTADFQVITAQPNTNLKYFNPVIPDSVHKKPLSVCWRFGDGSAEQCHTYAGTYTGSYATSHLYATAGQYEVCLTIQYDGGCVAKKCQVVSVGNTTTATCSADFQVLTSTSNATGRYFSAIINNSLQKKPLQVCWHFGDGSRDSCVSYSTSYTGSYAVFHSYEHPGQYEACITIKYDGGCEAKKCNVVTIPTITTCSANFQVTSSISALNFKYFNVLLADSLHHKPLQVCWNFGDGTAAECHSYAGTFTGTYFTSHQYAHSGQFEACVTIKYDGGCEAKKCLVVTVLPPATTCEVKLYEAAASETNFERKYYAALQDGKTADTICWNFGDGSMQTCTRLSNPVDQQALIANHTFPAPGNYHVCLRVVYTGGCVAERCIEVTIRPQSTSTCGGYITQQVTTAGSVLLKGFSIHDPNDNPVQFNWTFGDGSTGTGQQISHSYTGTGPFRVCLSIRTTSGCETNICTNAIRPSNSQPKLILSPNPVTSTIHVTFISSRTELVAVKIYNANGVLLRTFTKSVVAGTNTWDVDLGSLPTGVYSMVVQSANQFATAIFFKQ